MSASQRLISVIGLGYVGLTTAVGFGLNGHEVIGIDIDNDKVDKINGRVSYIYEDGLSKSLEKVNLKATTNFEDIYNSDITFLCVGTPSNTNGTIELMHLIDSVNQLTEALRNKGKYHLIVIRSTIIPGETESVILPLLSSLGEYGICVNPEFLREGNALQDFMTPSRIVIGENDKKSGDMLSDLYTSFGCDIIRTDIKSAEMIKYASNLFLATKISYINEIGNICKKLGINVYDIARGMGYDSRIGSQFLNAGIGFGGSCLPKDLAALISKSHEIGYEPRILEQVLQVNNAQPLRMIELLKKHTTLRGKTIGVLGLAFKPETNDIRESSAITITKTLLEEEAQVIAYDPQAMPEFSKLFPQIDYVNIEQVMNADAILIVTAWSEFENLDYTGKIVIDGRMISKAKEAMIYEGICW